MLGRATALEQAFEGLGEAVKSATRAVELLAAKLEPWKGKLDDGDDFEPVEFADFEPPTRWAYQQACKALHKWRARATELELRYELPKPSGEPVGESVVGRVMRERVDTAERAVLLAWAGDAELVAKTYRSQADDLSTPSGTSAKGNRATGAAEALERMAKRMHDEAKRELEPHELEPPATAVCDALRNPEPGSPSCSREPGHDGAHKWDRFPER